MRSDASYDLALRTWPLSALKKRPRNVAKVWLYFPPLDMTRCTYQGVLGTNPVFVGNMLLVIHVQSFFGPTGD
jgi:hypothetical protein